MKLAVTSPERLPPAETHEVQQPLPPAMSVDPWDAAMEEFGLLGLLVLLVIAFLVVSGLLGVRP